MVFARSVLNKLANKHIHWQQSAKTANFCHKWTLKFPNSLNLMWWHIFKQPNRSGIILMYVKLENKACRPQSPKAGGLVFLHCTNFYEISAVLPLRPYKWQQLILLLRGGGSSFIFDYFVICLIFLTCPFHSNISGDGIFLRLVSTPCALKINCWTECQPAFTTMLLRKKIRKSQQQMIVHNKLFK